jgi:hypothetical protein
MELREIGASANNMLVLIPHLNMKFETLQDA